MKGKEVFYKCPLWHFKGVVLRKLGVSSWEVEITEVVFNKSSRKLEIGQKVLMTEDELNKELL